MVRAMFDAIAPRYDLVNRLMTFGLDRGWRRRTVQALELAPGALVVDLACGTGDLTRELTRARHRAVGVDLSFEMLAAAHSPGGPMLEADAVALPFASASVDGMVSGFALRNFADLPAVLAEAARILRPGGRLSLLEVDTPRSALVRAGHRIWFNMAVPRIGALLSDAAAYRYLPRSVAYLPDPEALAALLRGAGFDAIARTPLAGGAAQLVRATRAGGQALAAPDAPR